MDSGNSGSISSSGDEEYDSHADPWFVNHANTHFGSISQSEPQPSVVASMFDVSSNYQENPNPECVGPRSEPNSSAQPAATRNGKQTLSVTNNNNAVRNSKKRSRASRRAPTTVLTTDTTNFRSMVQEFTGIPAPPFSASSSSSSFYSRRLPLVSTHSRSLLHNNMNIPSATVTSNNNSLNYHLPPDSYHQPHNMMQNHHILPFNSSSSLHTIIPTAAFGAKSSFDDDVHVNDCRDGRDPFRSLDGNY